MTLTQPVEVTDKDVAALLAEVKQAVRTIQAIVYGRPPSSCPYCQSPNISGGMGNYDCNDCGRSWSV